MPDPATPPDFWKRKLAAFLHDPPEKAYDFGPSHLKRAESHAGSFGVWDLWKAMGGNPDWSAAAADRFVFPHGSKVGSLGEDPKVAFVHPISGRAENTSAPTLPTGNHAFPTQADAEQWISDIKPDWQSDDPKTLFLRAWRLWPEHAASHAAGSGKGAELTPYLPADTRVPDGSIWHHCAVVSALEACRTGDDLKAPLKPAFLLFQVGPVQEFIGQARSTRDSWSGSYLLSWLMMHAIKAVADLRGPDAVIFPSLKGQPIYDWLEQERLGLAERFKEREAQAAVLVPGIPNRFLAIVPEGFDAAAIAKAFEDEWKLIAAECRQWLADRQLPVDKKLWTEQVEQFWQITWQLWPWKEADEALTAFKSIPLGKENAIHLAKEIAEGIPAVDKDRRCYRDGKLDPGWAWSAHYQLCQHALDARRAIRDFRPFANDPRRKSGHRDCLSGREEAVVQADKIEAAKQEDIRRLFRHVEPLGAANLIKRVWHKAYLEEKQKLKRARESFDSVPAVAAGAFASRLYERSAKPGELREKWLAFCRTAEQAKDHFPDTIASFTGNSEEVWLSDSDHSMFFPDIWRREQNRRKVSAPDEFYHSPEVRQKLAAAEQALQALLSSAKTSPSPYYAVIALDGDQIGRWLSGEKSPSVEKVITTKAVEYFRQNLPPDEAGKWLASPRPISPSWHLQFSEALANFSLYAVRRVVEDVHHGQLIYAGGDDALAMVPADAAIACATDLRAAFQGKRSDMSADCQKHFNDGLPDGFIQLANPQRDAKQNPIEPTWPLLVPGPRMSVSVGIAIGHSKEPLQDMIAEAQKAEKRAKGAAEKEIYDRSGNDPAKQGMKWRSAAGWDRDALAVTLFKRSGETIEWGAKFTSTALPLLAFLRQHFRPAWDQPDKETAISGRFPYRLAGLLGVYDADKRMDDSLRDIALKEFEHVITRQTITDDAAAKSGSGFHREALRKLGEKYLSELLDFKWKRKPRDTDETPAARSLRQFINLFLLEAFIRRQAD